MPDYLLLMHDEGPGTAAAVRQEDWGAYMGGLQALGLAPLRADVLAGDLRLFYLLWLVAVQDGAYEDDVTEPMPGLGPMTGSLEALVNFFGLDADLVATAAERRADWVDASQEAARRAIANMSDTEKTQAHLRFLDGDPHVAADLRAAARALRADHPAAAASGHRTVGEVLARAEEIAADRVRAAAAKRAADKRRHAEQAEQARRARLLALKRRGESAWRDVEADTSNETRPPMIGRPACWKICARLPRNTAAPMSLPGGCGPFASGTRKRSGSSSGLVPWDNQCLGDALPHGMPMCRKPAPTVTAL